MQLEAIGQKIKGLLINPIKMLQDLREESLEDAFLYYLLLVLFSSVMTAIVSSGSLATMQRMLPSFLTSQLPLSSITAIGGLAVFIFAVVASLVFVFIGGIWLHLWVYLLKGRQGFSQTLKALFYGATPALLFSWIPVVGLLASLWTLVLEVIGVKELQQMSTGKAILAVFLALFVPFLVMVLLVFAFITASTAALSGLAGL